MPRKRSLEGGTFNLKYGRDPMRVAHEVNTLIDRHKLKFLCVQEAQDYFSVLHNNVHGFRYYTTREYPGGSYNGILVSDVHRVTKVKHDSVGDGWTTENGHPHVPCSFSRLTIDGWLRVASIHLPTPTEWINGVLHAPDERRDDAIEHAKTLVRFLAWPDRRTRVAAGDWNEPPTTQGKYSPGWIAHTTHSKAVAPAALAGHGRIDYPMVNSGRLEKVFKDLNISELSDHEPVVFTVLDN
jgi:exonuclease III